MKFQELPKREIKRLLRRTLSALGPERFRSRREHNLLVLMYHRVLPENHPDRNQEQPGMYVSPGTLDLHMRLLKARFELVRLADWVKRARAGLPLPKFACAVTFDDGWRDNFDYAYPILKKYEIPATIFVVSRFVGTRYRFWPNRIMRLFNQCSSEERIRLLKSPAGAWLQNLNLSYSLMKAGALNFSQLDELVEKCKAFTEDELLEKLEALESIKGEEPCAGTDMMDWDQLRTMRAGGLIDIGSHTCRHRRLTSDLSSDTMQTEIEASKDEIQRKLGAAVEAFCYPNGDYTDDAVEHVRRNYAFACTTRNGWNTQKSDFLRLKRIGVHEDIASDRHAFLARLSGLV